MDGCLLFELRDVADARTVAVDSEREVVWVYRPGELAQFRPDGSRRLSLDLLAGTAPSVAMAIHPKDGSLWLAEGETLQNIGYDGQRFRTVEIGAPVEILAIDSQSSRLWAGDSTGLTVFDAVTGTVAQSIVFAEPVRDLALEPTNGRAWVSAGERLWRVDTPADKPEVVIDPLGASSLAIAEGGRLFVARGADVLELDDKGRAVWSRTPVSEVDAVVDLVASQDGHTLWAATEDRIVKLTGDGEILTRLAFEPPVEVRALALDRKKSAAERFGLAESFTAIDPAAVVLPALRGRFATVAVRSSVLPSMATVELRAEGGRVVRTTRASGSGRVQLRVEARSGESLFLSARDPESGELFGTEVLLSGDRRGSLPPPPDPSGLANAVDPTIPFNLHANVQFLWDPDFSQTGEIVQEGVTPGFIKPSRAMVLRGRAFDAETGDEIEGVQVSALEFVDYGTTQSRLGQAGEAGDLGRYDFAVQGGGWITLEYFKDGYLPVRRKRQLPRRRFAKLPNVYMTRLSETLTTGLDSGLSMPQIAEGDENTDTDGTRKLRFFFPTGVNATQVMPDGTQQLLTDYTLRSTEFTVGDNGPEAMPAPLPPNSGYTFAFEATITEAEAAGAEKVTFDQPVAIYTEDFLQIGLSTAWKPEARVGEPVPVGYYDEAAAKWVPAADGIVLSKIGVDGSGQALIDDDGDNVAETPAELLADHGITGEELVQVHAWFPTNQTIWRVATDHFSIPDWNWGFGIPDGAIAPSDIGTDPHADEENPNCVTGSIIECQNQQLREALPIVGTPFALTYATSRAPGRKVERTWDIVYRTEDLGNFPSEFEKIVVTVEVAGQVIRHEPILDGSDPGVWKFVWDGFDVYGRRIFGGVPAVATVSYLYEGALLGTGGGVGDGFGGYSGSRVVLYPDRSKVALVKTEQKTLYSPVPGPIAGWSLDVLHQYDPYTNIITLGDGRKRNAHSLTQTLTTIAGADPSENYGWQIDVPALESELHEVSDVVATPDGGYLIAEFEVHRIRKITVDGMIELFAGTGFSGTSGDDDLAVDANVGLPTSVAIAPDESVYICHRDNSGPFGEEFRRIRRVTPDDGIIRMVLDDSGCEDLAVSPDGRVYYTDAIRHSIYRLEEVPGGFEAVIVAGDGTPGYVGDGDTVVGSRLNFPSDLAFSPEGTLFFGDINNRLVREITTDGLIRRLAGIHNYAIVDGDGGPAGQAGVGESVEGIEVDPTGRVYIGGVVTNAGGWGSVREIDPRKTIRTIAGANSGDPLLGGGGPATAQKITNIRGLSWDPEGRLVVVEQGWNHGGGNINFSFLKRLGGLLPPYDERIEYAIPAQSGDEIYFFDGLGRHELTADGLTGAILWDFVYEPAPAFPARLIEVLDVDGRKTEIERDGAGAPTAIIGPDGQRTELLVDGLGWLQAVRNPALETYKFKNTADGLLEELEPPNGLPRVLVEHDADGRLMKETDRAGGHQELILTPTAEDDSYEVGLTTAMARTTIYDVEPVATGGQKRTNTSPALVETIRTILPEGTTTLEYPEPDGPMGEKIATTVTWREGPDPRFGQIAPVIESFSVTTPGGKTASLTTERTLTLADPDDITSLDTQTDTITFNGRESTLVYTKTDPDPIVLGGELVLTTAGGRTIETTLDEKGRVEQVQFAGYQPIVYSYDAVTGRLDTVTQHLRSVSYDYYDDLGPRQGFLKTITQDQLGETTEFDWYDSGRVKSQTFPGGTDSVGFGYDANGNLDSVTPPGRPSHLFHYTLDDRIDGYQAPAPDPTSSPAVTQSVYNLDHQVETVTRPDSKVIDPLYNTTTGRLERVTVPHGLPGSTGDYVFTYEPVTGKLSTVTDPDLGVLTYGYDGPLVTSVDWSGEVDGTVSATYTHEFWLDVQTVDAGGSQYAVTYTYDDDGLLTGAGELTALRETQPVNTGQLESTTLGIITDSYGYDPDYGELESYSVTNGTEVLYSYTIDTRDDLGRIIDKTETIESDTKVYHYDYDARGRLTDVFVDTVLTEHYEYDANSNHTAWTLGSTSYTASHDDQDRLTSYGAGDTEDILLLYGANGELQSKTQNGASVLYDYDVFGNLRRVLLDTGIQIEYVIDGASRRVGKKINGVLNRGWLYQDQLNPVAELDDQGNVVWRFVYGTKSNVPDYMEDGDTGEKYRLITDHLGSLRLVVDESGTVVQRIDYDAFGRITYQMSTAFRPFGFAGGLYDDQTGLVRFGARDYDPEVGRWTAKDPIGFGGGDSNLYGYAFQNPLRFSDPSGLEVLIIGRSGPMVGPRFLPRVTPARPARIPPRYVPPKAPGPLPGNAPPFKLAENPAPWWRFFFGLLEEYGPSNPSLWLPLLPDEPREPTGGPCEGTPEGQQEPVSDPTSFWDWFWPTPVELSA